MRPVGTAKLGLLAGAEAAIRGLVLASLVLSTPQVWAQNGTGEPGRAALRPRVLRQNVFNIPFSVDASSSKPIEVHLYVSVDGGASWQLYARRHPSAGYFPCRAAGDGRYWFASRTIDQSLTPPDTRNMQPELYVIVDTVEPQFEFDASVGDAGEVQTSWRITDATLDVDTLKIEYQPRIGQSWKPVAVDRQQHGGADEAVAGSSVWWPEVEGQTLNVRAEVSDRAGNKSVVSRLLFLPQRASAARMRTAPPPADPFATAGTGGEKPVSWPPEAATGATEPRRAAGPSRTADVPDAEPTPAAPPTAPPQSTQLVGQRQAAADATLTAASTPGRVSLPAGERPRATRSTRFHLDYHIDAVGPSGIKQVELWGTSDRGRTWSLWRIDQDRQSPVEVEVDGDGLFGFRVVIVGNSGLAGPAPRNGDLADLWVAVDTAAPSVRLTSVIYGQGDRAGQLDIRWAAEDTRFGERPITLSFSDQAGGPWTTIASGLPNSGQYYWTIDPRVPKQVYLRIEARDEAGNQGDHELEEPIAIAGLIPKARIRGLRPAPKTSRAPIRNPFVR